MEGNIKVTVSKINTLPLDEMQFPMKIETPAKSVKSKADEYLASIDGKNFLDDSIQKYHKVFDTS